MRRWTTACTLLLTVASVAAGCATAHGNPAQTRPPIAAVPGAPNRDTSFVVTEPRTFLTAGGWACLIDARRDLYCWLLTDESPSNIPHTDRRPTFSLVPGLVDVVAVDGKEDYVCALDARGAVHCWGCMLSGEHCRLYPSAIALPAAARQIAVGVDGACALNIHGAVHCWGMHTPAATHAGTPSASFEQPYEVGLTDVVQLSATALGRCALDRAGQVACWGECAARACTTETPRPIQGLDRAHAIASNRSYSCAITGPLHGVQCWGLPDADKTDWDSARPRSTSALSAVETLGGLRNVRQLELGERFGVAVTDDGALYHWGADHSGGIRTFAGDEGNYGRPAFAGNLEPQFRAHGRAMPVAEDLDLEVSRISDKLEVQRVMVTGYYTCLTLARGAPWCESTLQRVPFQVSEVWPSVRFQGDTGP